ncbi:MAG TPA: VCBS repeat-containing protein, partial [Pyrinomonadaceae bacterium]|nr:VCBS repeat-containing protein [Pyrinomonadaceae bacterium]
MSKNPLTRLILPVILAVFVFFDASTAFGQCGTHFRSDYRAVDKIRRVNTYLGGDWVLTDWTGDGRSDFWNFRFNQTTQTADIVIFPALPTGYWNWDSPIILVTSLPSSATTVNSGCCFRYQFKDFDSDGKLDMLIGDLGSPDYRIHRNTGNGTLVPQAVIARPGDPNTSYFRQVGYADVNSDGRLDWIYRLESISNGEETFYYSIQNADGSFGTPNLILANDGGNDVNNSLAILGDFDGDGKVDILYKSFSFPSERFRVLKNMGGGTFTLGSPLTIASLNLNGVGDLNNDGRLDVYGDGGSNLVVLYGQNDATFTTSSYPETNTNPTAYILSPVDFNGDGRLDLINADYNDYEIFLSDGAGGFTPHFYSGRVSSSYPSIYAHFEDFNADGKADLYDTRHEIFNTFSEEVVVIKSNVCDSRGQTRGMNFDSIPTPDIVTWNGASGQWRFGNGDWNSSANIPAQSFNWGADSLGDVPAPGDFDGDGLTDFTVYRNGEGNWYVLLSSNASWFVFHFGSTGDIPIPNDYDGGGKTDFAVFRPSDGNWYIWYTETQQFGVVHWGANGDRPVPADFDGDG